MIARIARRPELVIEILEPRRLLSSDGAPVADDGVLDWEDRAANPSAADLIASDAGADHLVMAPTRTPIYPPLAPAMWVDDSVGSFELPEAITVAFFAPDPPSEHSLGEEEEREEVATEEPRHVDVRVAPAVDDEASPTVQSPGTSSITELLFEPDRRLAELDGVELA